MAHGECDLLSREGLVGRCGRSHLDGWVQIVIGDDGNLVMQKFRGSPTFVYSDK